MRILIAKIFKLPFFKKYFFSFHTRIVVPLNLFKGLVQTIKLKNDISFELHLDDWI